MPQPSVNRDTLLAEFCDEALDLLRELPDRLVRGGQSADAGEIDFAFRSIHTIKGNAGFFGLPVVKNFAHRVADALDEIRQGRVALTAELCRRLVEGVDALDELVLEVQQRFEDARSAQRHAKLLGEIERLCQAGRIETAEAHLLESILELADEIGDCELPDADRWSERLRSLAAGDARKDASAGDHREDPGGGPQAATAPEDLLEVSFGCGQSDISDLVRGLLRVFVAVDRGEFSHDDGPGFLEQLDALAAWGDERAQPELATACRDAGRDFATVYESPVDLDPLLMSVVWEHLVGPLGSLRQKPAGPSPPPASPSDAPPPQPSGELSRDASEGKPGPGDTSAKGRFIRVREEHVDSFLEDVSSLFITCERLKDLQQRMADELQAHKQVDELRQINGTLASQSTALQRSVVELRKVPARNLFSKYPRVARSLAAELGKQLDVHLEGEDVEIDKSLVEALDGPLMHMIRNVCDHGIETPECRRARGLDPVGNLWLACSLSKTRVITTIRDDGRGIDPERLRHTALERGLLGQQEAASMSDQEAVELIFQPGFSTAAEVSDISGRGVGLDVVRTRLREQGGEVAVASTVGEGTCFRLEVPIRRAVVAIDSLLVRQGSATLVIPFTHIREIAHVRPGDLSSAHGQPIACVRGDTFAMVALGELLEPGGNTRVTDEGTPGIVLHGEAGTEFLLLVDAVVGQRKVVVNDLPAFLPASDLLSGVAQLGAGELALVLNPREMPQSISQTGDGRDRRIHAPGR